MCDFFLIGNRTYLTHHLHIRVLQKNSWEIEWKTESVLVQKVLKATHSENLQNRAGKVYTVKIKTIRWFPKIFLPSKYPFILFSTNFFEVLLHWADGAKNYTCNTILIKPSNFIPILFIGPRLWDNVRVSCIINFLPTHIFPKTSGIDSYFEAEESLKGSKLAKIISSGLVLTGWRKSTLLLKQ